MPSGAPVTALLAAVGRHEPGSREQLWQAVYGTLHALAARHMAGEAAGHTLQPTALVHEAFVKLVRGPELSFPDRASFYRCAAEAMRRLLVDHARARGRLRRGGGRRRLPLTGLDLRGGENPAEMLALEAALCRLEQQDPRMSEVVKLRFFAGLSLAETAAVMGVSVRTVKREWACARAWLYRALRDDA